jgi:hypothetical protein
MTKSNADMRMVGFLMVVFIVGLALVIYFATYPDQNYSYYLLVIGAPMMGISAIVIWHEFVKK